jgi:hypothetical protein
MYGWSNGSAIGSSGTKESVNGSSQASSYVLSFVEWRLTSVPVLFPHAIHNLHFFITSPEILCFPHVPQTYAVVMPLPWHRCTPDDLVTPSLPEPVLSLELERKPAPPPPGVGIAGNVAGSHTGRTRGQGQYVAGGRRGKEHVRRDGVRVDTV